MQELNNKETNDVKSWKDKIDLDDVKGATFSLLELKRVQEFLAYKDFRSVERWCRKNKVFIIKQGNCQYVNEWEFVLSFYEPFIKDLKQKHQNWNKLFLMFLKGEVSNLINGGEDEIKELKRMYKPRNRNEKSFLNKMKNL